jgi:hypothetical protein
MKDGEIEAKLMKVKFPNGPEDKLIEKYGFTWDFLKETGDKKDWPLASKLAACLVEMGLLAEELVERATFWELMANDKGVSTEGEREALMQKLLDDTEKMVEFYCEHQDPAILKKELEADGVDVEGAKKRILARIAELRGTNENQKER